MLFPLIRTATDTIILESQDTAVYGKFAAFWVAPDVPDILFVGVLATNSTMP